MRFPVARTKLLRIIRDTYVQDPTRFVVPKELILLTSTLKRRVIRQFFLNHTLQVSSFGGAGTTMLLEFFAAQRATIPDPKKGNWACWKHMKVPPADRTVPDGFRAIYVIGDPRDAVLSVFRRGYQHSHLQQMEGRVYRWDYRSGLENYLDRQEDIFGFAAHFNHWTQSKRHYPIMIIKYEAIWEYLPQLVTFARLPLSCVDQFPPKRERQSSWRNCPAATVSRLNALLQPLADRIDRYPACTILSPNHSPPNTNAP